MYKRKFLALAGTKQFALLLATELRESHVHCLVFSGLYTRTRYVPEIRYGVVLALDNVIYLLVWEICEWNYA